MKRLLMIMPFFMGYEDILVKELQKKYYVTLINSDNYDRAILSDFCDCKKTRWVIRKLSKKIRNKDLEHSQRLYLEKSMQQINLQENYYHIIFCINGAYLSDEFYEKICKKNPNAKSIYYAWDDAENLIKMSHIRYFNNIYSYNIDDCTKNIWKYMPMFVQSRKYGHAKTDEYDIAFIGSAHTDRKKIAKQLYECYSKSYRLFIYLFDPNHSDDDFCMKKPLPYNEYMEILRKSKTILDIPSTLQSGPTTRAFDALLTKTKVITVNHNIKKYPVYSKNIQIIERENITIEEDFIKSPYVDSAYKPLDISTWITRLGL